MDLMTPADLNALRPRPELTFEYKTYHMKAPRTVSRFFGDTPANYRRVLADWFPLGLQFKLSGEPVMVVGLPATSFGAFDMVFGVTVLGRAAGGGLKEFNIPAAAAIALLDQLTKEHH